jgi:hypothetical protein
MALCVGDEHDSRKEEEEKEEEQKCLFTFI